MLPTEPVEKPSYSESRYLEYETARHDLDLFVQTSWDILEPQTELKWNWHHDLICEHLQACATGQLRRLIINVAPRSTKSILSTICFAPWLWISDPSLRFLFGSYADALARKHSVLRRNIIQSPWYQAGYGKRFKLADDVNTKNEFANDKTGEMKAAGINGSITGLGGDYLIIDDPHDPQGAESDTERETTIEKFDLAWSSRLNDKKTGRIIVIMQRLHERDLTGHLLEKGGYTHLKIPTIAEERETIVFPVTKRTVHREPGELMHPDRDGPDQIIQAKKDLGPYGFSGQHQQNPVPKSGGIFRPEMFSFGKVPDSLTYRFVTADTAYSDREENDFTVFTAWGVDGEQPYILDVFRKHIKADEVEAPAVAFIKRFNQYGFRGAWIEPKGHGIYLNGSLRKKNILIPSEDAVKEFFSDRKWDKVTRANNAVPHLANRRIIINETIAEKEELLAEVLKFPKARHDDFTDTVVDGIKCVFAREVTSFDVL